MRRPSREGRRWLSYVLRRFPTCLIYADANEGPIPSIPVIRSPSVPSIAMIVVYIIPLRARAGFDRAHGACMGLNGNTRRKKAQAVGGRSKQSDARGGWWRRYTAFVYLVAAAAAGEFGVYIHTAGE